MKHKKEIKQEELAKVNGGETYNDLSKLQFLYGLDFHVEVHTWRIPILYKYQFTKSGKITALGYTVRNGKYSPCYYITCNDKDYSGWYDEDYLQDSTYSSWEKIDTTKTVVNVVNR